MVTIERVYAAGVCNISKDEEARRLATGWIGTVFTLALGAGLLWGGAAPGWRLTLFFPAALAATGFLQAGLHFCAGYGMKGVFNVAAPVGTTSAVADPESLKKDKAKAQLIFGLSLAIGAAVAVVGFVL